MSVITIRHVTKKFGDTEVVKEFTDEFKDGEFVTLLGPSGCGKTTMLRMIAGFEKPTTGEILIDGKTVTGDGVFVPPEKRGIGMVFQSYAVWPHMNVFDNVAYPLKIQHVPKQEIKDRVEKVLEIVHLSPYVKRMPSELSGGQQQRVALGRALVAEPRVLLLDEPLSNLDAKLREEMRFEIKEITNKSGINVIFVTHDQSEAMTMSDRVFVIDSGYVQQVGTPMEIYRHPANPFVADFVGKVNFLSGIAEEGSIRIDGVEEPLPYDGKEHGRVEIAVRPEHIRIVQDSSGGTGAVNGADPGTADAGQDDIRPSLPSDHMEADDAGQNDSRFSSHSGHPVLSGEIVSEYYLGEENECRVRVGDKVLRVFTDADTYGKWNGTTVGLAISEFKVFPKNDGG